MQAAMPIQKIEEEKAILNKGTAQISQEFQLLKELLQYSTKLLKKKSA